MNRLKRRFAPAEGAGALLVGVWQAAPQECRRLTFWALTMAAVEAASVVGLAQLAPARPGDAALAGLSLPLLLAGFALAQLALLLVGWGQRSANDRTAQAVLLTLSQRLHDRLTVADLRLAEQLPAGAAEQAGGTAMQRLVSVLPALTAGASAILGLIAVAAAALVAGGGVLLLLPLAATAMFAMVLRAPPKTRVIRPLRRAGRAMQSGVTSHWQGLKAIRGLALQSYVNARFARRLRHLQRWREIWQQQQRAQRLQLGLLTGLSVLVTCLLVVAAGNASGLAALLVFGWRFVARIGAVQGALSALATSAEAYADYQSVLDALPLQTVVGGRSDFTEWRELRFENLAVRAGNGWRLPPVTGALSCGGWLALAGPSGCGKTTLLEVLAGLRRADSGRLILDGRDLPLDGWNPEIAYAPQVPWGMPDATVRANLACGRVQTEESLQDALRNVGAAALIARLDSMASGLSQGERQRLAVARALLSPAPLLLLDEPSSALDEDSESHLVASLAIRKGRQTIITVSHRQSLNSKADTVCEFLVDRVTAP